MGNITAIIFFFTTVFLNALVSNLFYVGIFFLYVLTVPTMNNSVAIKYLRFNQLKEREKEKHAIHFYRWSLARFVNAIVKWNLSVRSHGNQSYCSMAVMVSKLYGRYTTIWKKNYRYSGIECDCVIKTIGFTTQDSPLKNPK